MHLSFKNNARTLVRTMYNVLPDSGLGLTELSNIEARNQVKQRVCALLQDYSFLYEQVSDRLQIRSWRHLLDAY